MVPGLAVRITARSCLLDRSPCILAVCSAPATSFGSSRSLSLVVCLFLPLIHSYSLLLSALMFIGPFAVYLGGLLGPSHVLRIVSISFTRGLPFLAADS